MDTVFRVYNPDLKTEFYLLYDRGAAEDGKVSKLFQTFTTTGVGNGKLNCLPICNFDCDNINWGWKAMLTSITIDLWETI